MPLGEVECHLHVFEQLVRKARIDPYPVGFGSSHDSFLPSDAAFGGLDWRVALVLFLTISDPKHYLDVRLEAAPGLKAVPVLDFNAVARQAVQDDCVGRQAQSMARHTPPCARVRSRRPRQTLVRSLFVTLDAVSSGESPAVPPWALVLGSHRHEHRKRRQYLPRVSGGTK